MKLILWITCLYLGFPAGTYATEWTWKRVETPAFGHLTFATFTQGQFFIGGYNGWVLSSVDGAVWTEHLSRMSNTIFFDLTAADNRYYAVDYAEGDIWSFVGKSVRYERSFFDGKLNSIAYGEGVLVAVGDTGLFAIRQDGGPFEEIGDRSGVNFNVVRYADGMFVVGGQMGYTWHSDNGLSWERTRAANSNDHFGGLVFARNTWWAVTNTGKVFSSFDGKQWNLRLNRPDAYFYDIAYGYGDLVVAADDGRIFISSDGTDWVEHDLKHDGGFTGVAYGNRKFVLTSQDAVIYVGERRERSPLWIRAIFYDNGWSSEPWFGFFYDYGSGLLYHYDLGYMYTVGGSLNSFWLWTAGSSGWVWTSQLYFPWAYVPVTGEWIYLL